MRFCVFMGSRFGRLPAYREAAAELGRVMTARQIGVVYGGNTLGLMGVLAETAFALGNEVIGVIPHAIAEAEAARTELSKLHVVDTMHERKALMSRLSDAFIALPGGLGTLEELFEVWTWAQLGLHRKPIGLVDVDGYYQLLLRFVDHMVATGFLRAEYRDTIRVDADPVVLLDGFATSLAPRDGRAATEFPAESERAEPVDVLAWVLVRDGRLLNVRTTGKELFYLPGGKREPGESDPAGLAREIGEELGVRIDQGSMRLFDLISDRADGFANGRLVRMACYFAEYEGELTPGREIAELAWIGPAEALRCAPAGRQVLSGLAERGLLN